MSISPGVSTWPAPSTTSASDAANSRQPLPVPVATTRPSPNATKASARSRRELINRTEWMTTEATPMALDNTLTTDSALRAAEYHARLGEWPGMFPARLRTSRRRGSEPRNLQSPNPSARPFPKPVSEWPSSDAEPHSSWPRASPRFENVLGKATLMLFRPPNSRLAAPMTSSSRCPAVAQPQRYFGYSRPCGADGELVRSGSLRTLTHHWSSLLIIT